MPVAKKKRKAFMPPPPEATGAKLLAHGRLELLQAIAAHGSISAAARALGMSYRGAWNAVEALNNLAEHPLVVRQTGGKGGGGAALTVHGQRLIEASAAVEAEYQRFVASLGAAVQDFDQLYRLMGRLSMKTSARNQLLGRVTAVKKGAVNSEVIMDIGAEELIVAIVTNESVDNLALAPGKECCALVKASSVILATGDDGTRYSTRNRLCGTVVTCLEGAVNGEVTVELSGGKRITSIITNESIHNLELTVGKPVCALIKASSVILAVIH